MIDDKVFEEQIDAAKDYHISKMVEMEGWQILKRKIEERINVLTNRVISGEDSGTIETTETKKVGSKTYITIIQINRDEFKHELKFWKRFLNSVVPMIGKE